MTPCTVTVMVRVVEPPPAPPPKRMHPESGALHGPACTSPVGST